MLELKYTTNSTQYTDKYVFTTEDIIMEIFSMIAGFDIAGAGIGSLTAIAVGVFIGWCVPQPAFAQPFTDFVCDKFKLDRFHKEGHTHSDGHDHDEDEAEEKSEEK